MKMDSHILVKRLLKLLGQNMSAFLSLSDDDPLELHMLYYKNLDISKNI